MAEYLSDQKVGLSKRQALISGLACFSELKDGESAELAKLFSEVRFAPSETIVTEETLIDSVYIIVSGRAEVSHQSSTSKSESVPPKKEIIGELNPGEAIGLNRSGFFSSTGKRTATVTAFTPMLLLVLDLKKLQLFLTKNNLLSEMNLLAEKMLRIRIIKQCLPFSDLSHERLERLAEQVETVSVPAGAIIFKEGEIGDRSYLIRSGQIEIIHEKNGEERQLAILKSPVLFGEATLITNSPRNATARALEDSELLVLRHQYLSELIETEKNVADMFMLLMVDRSLPKKNDNVTVHPRVTADGQQIVVLKNPDNPTYFKLSEEGWFIWQQLDGKKTLQEITMMLCEEHNIFAPFLVAGIISKLARSGFVENVTTTIELHQRKESFLNTAMKKTDRILRARFAVGNVDHLLTSVYNKVGYFFFTRNGLLLLAAWGLAGFFAFDFNLAHVTSLFRSIKDSWLLLLLLIPFTVLTVVLHELAHALAAKSFGHEVRYVGVGWSWWKPIAFTDTTDMWLSTRWPRIAVNLAGPFSDVVVAGIASIFSLFISNAYAQCFLWVFALYTYINAFRALSPVQGKDGYYILMDLFDRPRLLYYAVAWLLKDSVRTLRNPRLIKDYKAEISYWAACIVYLILVSLVTLYVQSVFLRALGLEIHVVVSLILPFLAVLFSSGVMYLDIRRRAAAR